MPTINIKLTSGLYVSTMTIETPRIPGAFTSEWTCSPDDAFSVPRGTAANLLGQDDLTIMAPGVQQIGWLLNFKNNNEGDGNRIDDDEGKLSSTFRWEKVL